MSASEQDILRCNVLACRRPIADHDPACVTTCSHIFCWTCAETELDGGKQCPACQQPIDQHEDVYVRLIASCDEVTSDRIYEADQYKVRQPGSDIEKVKACAWAGHPPSRVMDMAAGAVAFWAYQKSEEIAYLHAVTSNLLHAGDQLKRQLDDNVAIVNAQEQRLKGLESRVTQSEKREEQLNRQLAAKERELRELRYPTQDLRRHVLMSADSRANSGSRHLAGDQHSSTDQTTMSPTMGLHGGFRPYSAPGHHADLPTCATPLRREPSVSAFRATPRSAAPTSGVPLGTGRPSFALPGHTTKPYDPPTPAAEFKLHRTENKPQNSGAQKNPYGSRRGMGLSTLSNRSGSDNGHPSRVVRSGWF